MAQLSTKIKLYVGSEVDFLNDVLLQDDGNGIVYIKEWNLDTPQPTQAQLDALETQADIYESNLQQDAKRKSEYGTWEFQLDEIYHQGIDAWKTRIQSIKDKYPKQ
jgi:hypothetical protein